MKLYKTIILAGAALVVAASCGKLNQMPVFNDADAFASFDKAKVSAAETAGVVRIPVTIASVNPIETDVVYSIDAQNPKCTAVENVDFELVDNSAVLHYADGARTAYVEINILPHTGNYTGDKSVIIKLDSSADVNLGFEKTCELVINDLDHPLANILGEYTLAGYGTISFEKDPDDVSVIHIVDIFTASQNWCGKTIDMIGQVSADLSTIVIPLPIDFGVTYSNGEPFRIYACDAEKVYMDISSITLEKTDTGYSNEQYGLVSYIKGAGYYEWIDPPFALVKK